MATKNEVNETMGMSRALLMIATSGDRKVGMTSLLMATCIAARTMNIPMEDINALFDETALKVYAMPQPSVN